MTEKWFDYKQAISSRMELVLGMAGVILFLLIWQLASVSELVPRQFFPPPSDVLAALIMLFSEKDFLHDVVASATRVAVSFSIAVAVALPLGLLMGSFSKVNAFFNPLFSGFRYLPATAFVPLLLMWLGAGESQKITLLFIGVEFFLITLLTDNTMAVRTELIETAKTIGASRRQILWTVVFPASLPRYIDTMRQMLAVSWTYLVVAEIVVSTDGIGAMMMRAKRFLHVDEVMAGIIMIGVLGILFDFAFRMLHRFLFPYLQHQR